MRYLVLACDYDGTLAHHGKVDADTAAALDRLLASGRRLVLVTGRQLDDLARIFPELDRFELVVAENGAVLHEPGTGETKLLAEPPPPAFAQTLAQRGVTPLSVGSVIVATWRPHETTVLEVIRELGLELHVIFNKGAVMVLPSEVNKGSGFLAALATMGLSRHNAVGVGDAENDHTFLSRCECAVAVENALPPLKRRADLVVEKDHGAGVAQLIDQMLKDDLAAHEIARHAILLGTREDGRRVTLGAHGQYILVAGPSGTGKSETTRAILERVQRERYQACTIDPEGDYEGLSTAITIGDSDRAPTAEEVAQLLQQPEVSVIINLLGLRLPQRPAFCASLLPRLISLNGAIGRPHWVVVDEAHHVLPI
jgi:hydroxymethylpyrimidine pyrophosphatase-like HAD family hydrolase